MRNVDLVSRFWAKNCCKSHEKFQIEVESCGSNEGDDDCIDTPSYALGWALKWNDGDVV
jgi:hypothetical protein